jgi:hypothetical protein
MELNLEFYRPLTAEDRELLARWHYAEDHPLAKRTVFVGRLQRFLNSNNKPADAIDVDGKYGPNTDARTHDRYWPPVEKDFIECERAAWHMWAP